jgi:exopolyphosphatase/guanosine-5'-triphosphate,3'-diphosphate pyrophosphatase
MRLAALDLGSNSFHVLIADVDREGTIDVVDRVKRMPRIGEAIFRSGQISDAARKRALRALTTLTEAIDQHEPEAVLAVATSAVREARNGAAFVAEVETRFGFPVRVISGDEEARLSYRGARARLGGEMERTTLFDLGGGSLEVVIGEGARVLHTESAPLGVLRAVAESPLSAPARPRELRALEHWARRHVSDFLEPVRKFSFGEIVLCAGTARAVRAVARATGRIPDSGPGSDRIGRDTLRSLIGELAPLNLAARQDVPGLDPARADLIVHGIAILDALLAASAVDDARVCRAALREGLLLEHAALAGLDEASAPRRSQRQARLAI